MNKRITCFVVAAVIAMSATPVVAAPSSGSLQSQKSTLQQNKSLLKSAQDKREQLEMSIEKLDNKIEDTLTKVKSNKNKISQTKLQIKDAEESIKSAQNDIKDEQVLFNERMRAMYINGADGYLSMILESKGLGDFISRVDTVRRIMELDKTVINDLQTKKQQIQDKKKTLEEKHNSLIALEKDNEKRLSSFQSSRQKQNKLIAEAKKMEKMYASKVEESQSLVKQTLSRIESMNTSSNDSTSTRTVSRGNDGGDGGSYDVATSNSVVQYAATFQGTPYHWGAEGPNSFDCSGFTSYVYRHFGVSLPRTSGEQSGYGQSVSRSNLKPGDLVFFGSPVHHVGIYVGNGCYIHAPQTGDVVKISPLNRSDYAGARRVF